MDTQVIRMPVATHGVISHEQIRVLLSQDCEESFDGLIRFGSTEGTSWPAAFGLGVGSGVGLESGVVVAEECESMQAKSVGRQPGLMASTISEGLIRGEQCGIEGSSPSIGGQHKHYPMSGIDRTGDGAGTDEGLIIRMGMEEHDGSGRHVPIVSGPLRQARCVAQVVWEGRNCPAIVKSRA